MVGKNHKIIISFLFSVCFFVIGNNVEAKREEIIDSMRVYPENGRPEYTIYAYNSAVKAEKEDREIEEERTPNTQTFRKKDGTREIRVYSAPQFYRVGNEWNYIEYATTTDIIETYHETSWLNRIFPVAFAGESYITGTGDGMITSAGTTYSTVRGATSGTAYNGNTELTVARNEKGATNYNIHRAFFPFYMNHSFTITSASLHIYNVVKSDSTGNGYIVLVQTTNADENTLVNGDFDLCGTTNTPTEGANRVDITSISDNSYFEIPLNSTGLSWLNKTGYTKLGVRISGDVDNNAPNTGQDDSIYIRLSEYTGNQYDPYLSISIASSTAPATTTTEEIADIKKDYILALITGIIMAMAGGSLILTFFTPNKLT